MNDRAWLSQTWSGLLFGLAPACRAAREGLVTTLREGGRSTLPAAGGDRLRGTLVVAEIAVAIVLLVGAGLFIRSALRLQQVPLGFETRDVLSARVVLPEERYRSDEPLYHACGRPRPDGLRSCDVPGDKAPNPGVRAGEPECRKCEPDRCVHCWA